MRDVLLTPDDRGVARLAERQHGVVSAAQLRTLGIGVDGVHRRARQGRLHRVHRGVYAVGHPRLTIHAHYWAAVLAHGGPAHAVLSHRTAAAVWDLLRSPARRFDVTTLRTGKSTDSVRVHRSRTLADDATTHHGLPVTTVTRTLIDLADQLSPHQLERVCHRAEVLRLLDARAIATRLDELPGRRRRHLDAALATLAHADPQITRSELEERMLALIGQFGLPRPLVNSQLHGFTVDFLWKQHKLVIETDGAAAHATPRAREDDHRRDATLARAGYRVHRFTWNQVTREPATVAGTLRALLDDERA